MNSMRRLASHSPDRTALAHPARHSLATAQTIESQNRTLLPGTTNGSKLGQGERYCMLRKTKDLKGSKLSARDGLIGHLKDFYFDDQTWTLRYLVADTGDWLSERRVLLSPFAVTRLGREPQDSVAVNLTKQQIADSPSIEEHKPISRQYEAQYAQYYGWPNYWPGPLLWGPVEAPWAYLPANVVGPP